MEPWLREDVQDGWWPWLTAGGVGAGCRLCGEGVGLTQLYSWFVSLPTLILCPNVPMDCQKRVCQVGEECAGGADTTDESLLLSIAPVWEMSLGLQGSQPALVPGTHTLRWPFSQGALL